MSFTPRNTTPPPISPVSFANGIEEVRRTRPLIHHITNRVSINNCANVTLSIGATPVMADAIEEVEEMVSSANALVLNLGTLSRAQVDSMLAAGKAANSNQIPVILDPVGAGATNLRTQSAQLLMNQIGHEMMGALSGTGCMAASLIGAFAAACPDPVVSSVAALVSFGIAGERAAQMASGPYSFRTALIDEIAILGHDDLMQNAKIRSV